VTNVVRIIENSVNWIKFLKHEEILKMGETLNINKYICKLTFRECYLKKSVNEVSLAIGYLLSGNSVKPQFG
jgi:hypothetical protein